MNRGYQGKAKPFCAQETQKVGAVIMTMENVDTFPSCESNETGKGRHEKPVPFPRDRMKQFLANRFWREDITSFPLAIDERCL
jgi:hypothetical protein